MDNFIFAPNEHGASTNQPRMIIVHSMAEFLLDPNPIHASDFLEKHGWSAHALVSPDGKIYICRDDDQGAYHARGYNKNSLGIEFLVPGHHDYGSFVDMIKTDWCPEQSFQAGIQAVRNWCTSYQIPRDKVLRHSDVSPGRKVDPGAGFKWEKFLDAVFA